MRVSITTAGLKYTRDHWSELFRVFVSEGAMRPRFFLPTHRDYERGGRVCWIAPLAFIVVLYNALHYAFMMFWRDILDVVDMWHKEIAANPTHHESKE